MTTLARIPNTIQQGDAVSWHFSADNVSPQDGWTLTVYFVTASTTQSVETTEGGSAFVVTLDATTSGNLPAGKVGWYARATKGSESITVGRGEVGDDLDLASAGGFDYRSDVRKIHDALVATLQGKATDDQQMQQINGRLISRMSWEQVIAAEKHFRELVEREKRTRPRFVKLRYR